MNDFLSNLGLLSITFIILYILWRVFESKNTDEESELSESEEDQDENL